MSPACSGAVPSALVDSACCFCACCICFIDADAASVALRASAAIFSAASRVFSMDCWAAAEREPKKPPFLAAAFGASASAVVLPQPDSSAAAGAPAAAAAGAAAAVCLSRTSAAACAICWFEGSTTRPASYVANASSYRPRPYSAAPLRE